MTILALLGLAYVAGCPGSGNDDPFGDGVDLGDDDDSTDPIADDDDAADDDDSADVPQEVLDGTLILGTVVDAVSESPISGVLITKPGVDPTFQTVTGADGSFEVPFPVEQGDVVTLQATADGWLDVTLTVTRGVLQAKTLVQLAMFDREAEAEEHAEIFGFPYDETLCVVVVHFIGPEGSEFPGVGASIDRSYQESFVLDDDGVVPGSVPPADTPWSLVMFVGVDPGPVGLTLNVPAGVECIGATQIPATADTHVHVWQVCE